ncbi:winged helix-turn-helix transcriptional regulator [Falsihalocynthiibacter sp. BN13B15]|uniref:winged helix-turn-helix transcriptional regulator n=1 Tax=Falsihalocynthiibacter sp. BN13B15 TaxID=3240871 RepID=UPI00351021E4
MITNPKFMMHSANEGIQFLVLRHLEQERQSSQREIAAVLGYSQGVLNYCLKALAEQDEKKSGV